MNNAAMDIEPTSPAATPTYLTRSTISPDAWHERREAQKRAWTARRKARRSTCRKEEAGFVEKVLLEKRMEDMLARMSGMGLDANKSIDPVPPPSGSRTIHKGFQKGNLLGLAKNEAEKAVVLDARRQFKVKKHAEQIDRMQRGTQWRRHHKLEALPSRPRRRSSAGIVTLPTIEEATKQVQRRTSRFEPFARMSEDLLVGVELGLKQRLKMMLHEDDGGAHIMGGSSQEAPVHLSLYLKPTMGAQAVPDMELDDGGMELDTEL